MKKIYGMMILISSTTFAWGQFNTQYGAEAGNAGLANSFFGYKAGDITTGWYNTGVGYRTLYSNTEGYSNTAIGSQSGYSNTTGTQNTFIGHRAGHSTKTGNHNTMLGYLAGSDNITGRYNTLIGSQSGLTSKGEHNTFLGFGTGYYNKLGNRNVFIGLDAGFGPNSGNPTGSDNVFMGYMSGFHNANGEDNVFLGTKSGYTNSDGRENTFVGHHAGHGNIEGDNNVFIGNTAGYSNGIGNNNVFIGNAAGFLEQGHSKLYIDNGQLPDPLIYGDFADGYVAISYDPADVPGIIQNGLNLMPPHNYKLLVNGDAFANEVWHPSDREFKKNEKTIDKAMTLVTQLEGVTYEYKAQKVGGRNFSKGTQYGFIAQEVREVLPALVREGQDGFLAVNYTGIIPVLVEALKEQSEALKEQNETFTTTIEELKKEIAALKQTLNGKQDIGTTPENADGLSTEAVLYQNVPNPFSETTTIEYVLPATVEQAQLIVYDMNGRQLMKFNDLEAGTGIVKIEGKALKAGMYLYALLANDQIISTKRMVLTR